MRMRVGAWLITPLALFALIGAMQKPTEEQLKVEWAAFVKEYDAAYKEWLRPYNEAKTDEERSKVKIDFEKMPAKTFMPRATTFARKAGSSPYGLDAWLWVFNNAGQTGSSEKEAADALSEMLKVHIASPKLESVAQALRYFAHQAGPIDTDAALKQLVEKSPIDTVRASALYSLGAIRLYGPDNEVKKAKSYFDRLIREYPKSKAATQARSALFELNNLQIGHIAPDFEATDENGKTFKLSDYRGKVVVLDFWGFW